MASKKATLLIVEGAENGILFKKAPKLEDTVGIDAGYRAPEEINEKETINI
ncbi:MAG: hypothetical protein ABSD42_12725 [Candidatus Bathyarchaeia archaeon]